MTKPSNSWDLPRVLKSEIIFEKSIIKIREDELQVGQQPSYPYFSLLTPPCAVFILPITPEGAYLLTQEYRHPTGRILLGCPGGFMDPGEDSLAAAQRELLEETGYESHAFELIGSAYPYSGFSGQKTIFYRASGTVSIGPSRLETSEIIRTCLLTPEELKGKMKSADLDSTLCTALYFHSL